MRDYLLIGAILAAVPFVLARPYIGVLLFAWLSYMNPHRELAWSLAKNFPFAAIVGGATLVAMLFSKEVRKPPFWPIMIVWFGWILWMNVSTPFALEPQWATVEWERSMKIQLMALVTIMLMQDKQRLSMLVWVIVVSIGFYGVKGGIFAILTGGQYRVWGPEGTFFGGTNPLALALLMVLPLMFYLRSHTEHRLIRWALAASIGLTGIAVASTYSRGAFVAGAAVLAYLATKVRRKFLFVPLLVAGVFALAAFMPQRYYERIDTIGTYEEDRSAMGRINAWTVGWRLAMDRPFVGGGFQVYSQELFDRYLPGELLHDAHSIYFETLAEHGFVGCFLFVLLLLMALHHGRATRKLARGHPELQWAYDLASMTQVSLVAYAVGGAFLGLAYFDLYYHMIAILVLTRIEVNRQLLAGQEQAASTQLPAKTPRAPRRRPLVHGHRQPSR